MSCLYCYNKVDLVNIEECDRLARLPDSVVCRYNLFVHFPVHLFIFSIKVLIGFIFFFGCASSSGLDLNFDYLLEKLWEYLDLIRVYTKRKGGMLFVLMLVFQFIVIIFNLSVS